LIENIKSKETPLKEQRKQINTLKQAMNVELETLLTADELPKFQKALTHEKQMAKALLTELQRKAMYIEVQNYLKEAYFPVLKDKRLALEKQLNQVDMQKIATHKSELLQQQKTLKEKQQTCKTLKKMGQRKCLKAVRTLKKEIQSQNNTSKDWLFTNEAFSNTFNAISSQKKIWQTEINKILSSYYVNTDTANFPVKPNYFLKHASPLSFAFLDADKLAFFDEDFSTYGNIDFAYCLNGQPSVAYQLHQPAIVTVQVVNHKVNIEQNINEANLEAGWYTNHLSADIAPGLYLVRLILNGQLADVKRLAIP